MTSDRTVERLSRLLAMVPWVVGNPGASIKAIRERFGYESDSEVISDLELLHLCGLPGYGPSDLIDISIGEGDVVIDMADYFSRPQNLTAAEALSLLAAGLAVMSSGAAPPALERAVAKLQAVVAADGAIDVELDPEPAVLDTMQEAAAARRLTTITYTSVGSGETRTRDIEPWAVVASRGHWYVAGHCRTADGYRVFRIDRIRDPVVHDETFSPPPEAPPVEIAYVAGADDVTATIRLAPSAQWVTDYYPVTVLGDEDAGQRTIEFAASDPLVTARLLIRLGADAELVSGDEVAAATVSLRKRILSRYGASD